MLDTALFARFEQAIRSFDPLDPKTHDSLLLDHDGRLSIYYAPFDYVNSKAELVLIGITPGRTQMNGALKEARRQLERGADFEAASLAAKSTASFGGMRQNLVAMLDYFDINKLLGVNSCHQLFGNANLMLHATSVLRYPVFLDRSNYNGSPKVSKNKFLQRYVRNYFANEVGQLRNALFIPLGSTASEALTWLTTEGAIENHMVLSGFLHPSGANNERVRYLIGNKPKTKLSHKTNARKLDDARTSIKAKVAALRSAKAHKP
jgi:hypothetical protein